MLAEALGIKTPGIVACVGAGGKTSVMQSLAADNRLWPVVVTSTTKLFYSQVAQYPLVELTDCGDGVDRISRLLRHRQQAAWFSRQQGEKVIGLPLDWIDKLAAALPAAIVLVEADGARGCLIKAPNAGEPVLPVNTMITVGILNLSMLNQPLTQHNAHRLDLISLIINKQAGEQVGWLDIASLAVHPQGIFQHARGRKVLVLSSGATAGADEAAKQIAGYVKAANCGIARVVITSGYGQAMQADEVYVL